MLVRAKPIIVFNTVVVCEGDSLTHNEAGAAVTQGIPSSSVPLELIFKRQSHDGGEWIFFSYTEKKSSTSKLNVLASSAEVWIKGVY